MLTCSFQCVSVPRVAPCAAMTICNTLRTPVMPNQMKLPNHASTHHCWVAWKVKKAGMKPTSTLAHRLSPVLR